MCRSFDRTSKSDTILLRYEATVVWKLLYEAGAYCLRLNFKLSKNSLCQKKLFYNNTKSGCQRFVKFNDVLFTSKYIRRILRNSSAISETNYCVIAMRAIRCGGRAALFAIQSIIKIELNFRSAQIQMCLQEQMSLKSLRPVWRYHGQLDIHELSTTQSCTTKPRVLTNGRLYQPSVALHTM